MICVSKEYEIKTKMVQEQWLQLKMTFLFFYWVELTFGGEGIKIWWEGGRGGGMSKFLAGGGTPPIPPVGKTRYYIYIYIYIYTHIHYTHIYYTYTYRKELCQQVCIYNEEAPCTSHTSYAKVAILLLQDLSTLCVTDIYSVCFHLSVQCLFYNKFITPWTHLIRSNYRRSISQKSISH